MTNRILSSRRAKTTASWSACRPRWTRKGLFDLHAGTVASGAGKPACIMTKSRSFLGRECSKEIPSAVTEAQADEHQVGREWPTTEVGGLLPGRSTSHLKLYSRLD